MLQARAPKNTNGQDTVLVPHASNVHKTVHHKTGHHCMLPSHHHQWQREFSVQKKKQWALRRLRQTPMLDSLSFRRVGKKNTQLLCATTHTSTAIRTFLHCICESTWRSHCDIDKVHCMPRGCSRARNPGQGRCRRCVWLHWGCAGASSSGVLQEAYGVSLYIWE